MHGYSHLTVFYLCTPALSGEEKYKPTDQQVIVYHSWLPPTLLAPFCFGCRRVVMGVVASGAASILTVYHITTIPVCKRTSGSVGSEKKNCHVSCNNSSTILANFFLCALAYRQCGSKHYQERKPCGSKKGVFVVCLPNRAKEELCHYFGRQTISRVFCFRRAFCSPPLLLIWIDATKQEEEGGAKQGGFKQINTPKGKRKCKWRLVLQKKKKKKRLGMGASWFIIALRRNVPATALLCQNVPFRRTERNTNFIGR